MSFQWLKRYMPRSLFGRAALILILPVFTLLLVVSVVFIQRHFEGVTQQMTRTVAREVDLILKQPDLPAMRALAEPLSIEITQRETDALPPENRRRWYDFSGLVIIREFTRLLPELRAIELPDDYDVQLFLEHGDGALEIQFDRRNVSAANPHQLLVNMVFFGVLMTLIAFFYLRNQLRPITRLASAAEAFGRGRHEVYRPAGAIEVRAAGNAFLDMRARIERQIEQRTMMLSGVSHDLRTPLTRMKLGLSLLDEEERAPLERDVADMQRLLDGFLDFAKGTAEGEPEATDPVALVSEIVADCKRSDIPVELIDIEGEGEVALRPGAIRRAVENLVNNAVRYGNRAEVSVKLTDKSLRIRVEDDGPGISPEQREEAVKPFTRLEPARNQNLGTGVGLGLAIANDIARAHGGVLRLGESRRLGGLRADIVIAR